MELDEETAGWQMDAFEWIDPNFAEMCREAEAANKRRFAGRIERFTEQK
jgi:hypothetical protein